MSKENSVNIWVIISFIIGTLIGSGAIWQYQQLKIEKEKLRLEIEKAKFVEIENINKIRKNRDEKLNKIMELSPKLRRITNENKNAGREPEHLRLLRVQFMQLVDQFNGAEIELAKLENRKPIEFIIEGVFPEGSVIIDHLPPAALGSLTIR